MKLLKTIMCVAALTFFTGSAFAQNVIGSVDTAWALGGDHRIDIERVHDPVLPVTCYISHPITGGIAGRLGLAKDHSLFSITCVKDDDTSHDLTKITNNEQIISKRYSWFSKQLILNRFVDLESKNVVYMVTAQNEFIDGSPFSSTSVVQFH